MPRVGLKQATIDYRVFGPGDSPHPPVLFVHGALVDERLWTHVAAGLARQGFRCITPRWPLGAHTIPVNDGADLSPPGLATMIRDFMAAVDLSDVTLVGNDSGGGLCQFLIDAHPERVGRLVLTNCDAFDQFPPSPFTLVFALLRGPKSIKALSTLLRLRLFRHSPLGFGLLASEPDTMLTASWLAPCRTDSRIARDLAAQLRHIAAADLVDISTRFSRFSKPVTLAWGMADRCFRPSLAKRLCGHFPDSALVEIPDAKTFVPLDAPSAVVAAIAKSGARDD